MLTPVSLSLSASVFPIRVIESTLSLYQIFSTVILQHFVLFNLYLSVPLFVPMTGFSFFQKRGKGKVTDGMRKSVKKRLLCSPSLLSACVITNFVCVLCLQEREKADRGIDQCEYT